MNGQWVNTRKVFPEVDLAVLNGPSAPHLTLSRVAPKPGDDVLVVGWSRAPWLLPFWGKVALPEAVNPGPHWESSMVLTHSIGPGASGAPVLNTRGEVVSVVQGGFHTPPLNLGVPFEVLWDTLRVYTPTPGTGTEGTGFDWTPDWLPFSNSGDDSTTDGADPDERAGA